jgi:hypothetical protein
MIRWPCQANPERWFSTDRYELGVAIHGCRAHCPRLRVCAVEARDRGLRPVEGVLAGVLFNTWRRVHGYQPEQVKCDACRFPPPPPPPPGCGVGARGHRRRGDKPCVPCRAEESRLKNDQRKPRRKTPTGPVDVYEGRRRVLDEALRS